MVRTALVSSPDLIYAAADGYELRSISGQVGDENSRAAQLGLLFGRYDFLYNYIGFTDSSSN